MTIWASTFSSLDHANCQVPSTATMAFRQEAHPHVRSAAGNVTAALRFALEVQGLPPAEAFPPAALRGRERAAPQPPLESGPR